MFELTCKVSDLLPPLKRVRGATARRRTLPILEHIHFCAAAGHLWLTSTDMEIALMASLECQATGAALIHANKLTTWLSLQPLDADVTISADDEVAKLQCGKSRCRFRTLAAADFPHAKEGAVLYRATIPGPRLAEMLEQVSPCMARRDVRFYLNGMLLEIGRDVLTLVATDGHRMAVAHQPDIAVGGDEVIQAILPHACVFQMTGLSGDVQLSLMAPEAGAAPNLIDVKTDDFGMLSRLIDGKYPDYARLLPPSYLGKIEIDRAALIWACQRTMLCAHAEYHGITLEPVFNGVSSSLKISASAQGDESEDFLPIERDGGLPDRFGIRADYLIDALKSVSADKIHLCFRNETDGVELFMPEEGDAWRCLIMPMRS